MNLADVMDEIGVALDTITGLRVHPYYADRIVPPAAVIAWPEEYLFDATYGRGSDTMTIPVIVLTGRWNERVSRDTLAAFCDGSGAASIKAVVEAGTYTACDSVRVENVEFEVITIAGVDYLAGRFPVHIIGTGA